MNSAGDTHNTMHPKYPQKTEKNNKKTEHKKKKQNCPNAYLRAFHQMNEKRVAPLSGKRMRAKIRGPQNGDSTRECLEGQT